jgi:putative ABC transport system substrate-binding protein
VDGDNIAIEYRFANDNLDSLPELAADLTRRGVLVIAALGSVPALRAAQAATATIPIVFSIAADPVQLGLVASLNRPGGNLTGVATMNSEVTTKRLGILHELVPGATRFVLLIEDNSVVTINDAELELAASAIGGKIRTVKIVGNPQQMDAAFATLAHEQMQAVLVNASVRFYDLRSDLAGSAARHGVPTIYWDRALVEAGGLASYGTDQVDVFRQAGVYAGRIIKGESPSGLPIVQPTKFELVINRKGAKELGLTIPSSVLAIANEVIE